MSPSTLQSFTGKTAIICGASKGIGKETAKKIVRSGGSALVIARAEDALSAAKAEIEAEARRDQQFVEMLACDTTDIDALRPPLEDFLSRHGTPDYLLNVVGYAYPNYIHEFSMDDFKANMQQNYFGQVAPTLVLLPYFMRARRGHIAFVSSVGGFIGVMGYATYSPTKFALIGLAEVLRHELKPYNIDISVLYPPDTDTPGFERENLSKPPETALISEKIKLVSPEQVAEAFVEGLLKKRYDIIFGESRLYWYLKRLAPGLLRLYSDYELKRVRGKLGIN